MKVARRHRTVHILWMLAFAVTVACSAPEAPHPVDLAVIFLGHSNAEGFNVDPGGSMAPPPGLPLTDVKLERVSFGGRPQHDIAPVALDATTGVSGGAHHSSELATGLYLHEHLPDGSRLAILKLTADGSAVKDWAPGGKFAAGANSALDDFSRALGDGDWTYRTVVFLGAFEGKTSEADCRAIPTGARALIETVPGADVFWLRESSHIERQPFLSEEFAATDALEASGAATVLVTDDIITADAEQSDGRHYNARGHNALGGALIGPAILGSVAP
jgi:hypothetical protein